MSRYGLPADKSGRYLDREHPLQLLGPDGAAPFSGVIFDSNGNLFGTTNRGGSSDVGTIFELEYVAGVGWTETVLYNFQNDANGERPYGGLISITRAISMAPPRAAAAEGAAQSSSHPVPAILGASICYTVCGIRRLWPIGIPCRGRRR